MKLTFLGKTTQKDGSPTLFATSHDTFVVQGWKVSDLETLAQMQIPEHETAVEVPRELLLRFVPRD